MAKSLNKGAKMFITGLFLIIFPVSAVIFSKWGLDKYRSIRSEMSLLKDSIQMPGFQLKTYTNQLFDTSFTKGKMLLVHFAPSLKDLAAQQLLQQIQPIQKTFNKEDRRRYFFITYTSDSAAAIQQEVIKYNIDTINWKILPLSPEELTKTQLQYHIKENAVASIALVNFKGYICDVYNSTHKEEMELLKTHMAIVIPKKDRKRIEYRKDKDPYQ